MSASSLALLFLLCLPTILHSSPSSAQECKQMGVQSRSFKLVSNCNFTLQGKQKEYIQAPTVVLVVPVIYLLAFLVGLPANVLALWVLLFHTKKLPSTVLLINLTANDLLLLLALPFRIAYHFHGNDWLLGEASCRLVMALLYGTMYGSVLCLALVAVDRYIALVHPFGAKTLRSSRASLSMSLAVWVVALAAMAPLLASRQSYPLTEPRITTCHDALPEEEQETFFFPYFCGLFACCFLLPLVVILFCYGGVLRTLVAKGERYAHAVRVTVLVVVVFVVCLLPSNVLLLLHYSHSMGKLGEELYTPYMVCLALSTFNSCLDPFIFYYVSDDFRSKVRKGLCRRGGEEGQGTSSSSGTSRTKDTLLSRSNQALEHLKDAPV